jgi:hypothetical protein
MSREYITRHIPKKHYKAIEDLLLAYGAVERTDDYQFFGGGKPGTCYQWRLGAAHRDSPVRTDTIEHSILFRNEQQVRWEEYQADLARRPGLDRLKHWFDRVTTAEGAPLGHKAFRCFQEGHRWFTLCKYGRLHTNITSSPREYRPFYRLDGREIVSVDVSCAQPLMVGLTLRTKYGDPTKVIRGSKGREEWKNHPGEGEEGPIIVSFPEGPVLDGFANDIPQYLLVPSTSSVSHEGLDDFILDCLEGCMYERLMAATGWDRDTVKLKFMEWAYDRPRPKPSFFARAVEGCYPALAALVRRYYHEYQYWDYPAKRYKKNGQLKKRIMKSRLPLDMQELESSLMIGLACRLAETIPLVTIHDCFGTHAEHLPTVERAIHDAWMAAFGVAPRLKREEWSGSSTPSSSPERPPDDTGAVLAV